MSSAALRRGLTRLNSVRSLKRAAAKSFSARNLSASTTKLGKAIGDEAKEPTADHKADKERITKLEEQLMVLQKDNEDYLFRIRQMSADHKNQAAMLGKQVEDLQNNKQLMQDKVDRIEKVEHQIVNLYLEMKDRSHEDPDNPPAIQKERENLRRQNPLVVLDYLRASLRVLLSFKSDYENELKDMVHKKKTQAEMSLRDSQQQAQVLRAEIQKQESEKEELRQMVIEAEQIKDQVAEETKTTIEDLRDANGELMAKVNDNCLKIEALNKIIDVKDKDIQQKNIKLLKITQLESQVQINKMRHQFELAKLQASHVTSVRGFQKEESKLSKTEAHVAKLTADLKEAKQQIASFRHNIELSRKSGYEQTLMRNDLKIEKQKTKISEQQKEIRHFQYVQREKEKEMKKMKDEYDRLFAMVNKQNKRSARSKKAKKPKIQQVAESMYMDTYKNTLREKERENEELKGKIKRVMVNQHKEAMMRKAFELERQRFEGELASLRTQTAAAKGMTGRPRTGDPDKESALQLALIEPERLNTDDIRSLQQRNEFLEKQLRDYQNLRAISVTTAAAYERMLDEDEDDNEGSVRPGSRARGKLAASKLGSTIASSQRSYGNENATPSPNSMTPASVFPMTPASVGTPNSFNKQRLRVGSARSSVRPGSLLPQNRNRPATPS